MGVQNVYTINGVMFLIFGSGSEVIDCDWRRKFGILPVKIFFVVVIHLSAKQYMPTPPNRMSVSCCSIIGKSIKFVET